MKIVDYDMKSIIDQELNNGSNDLVTRETGNRIRERIERELKLLKESVIILLNFSNIGIIDYSCGDEIVAKLVSRLISGEYGEKYILIKGLNPHQRENIEVALERKRLSVLNLTEKGPLEIIGPLNNYLKETLFFVMRNGKMTSREVADRLGIELNTSSTRLINLYKKRLLIRQEELLNAGGRQFIYESILLNLS
ncbi:MAG TPA: hypothetical protein VMW81_08660 [Nitrospinota bacterium]|nr:hypothetical protein [Nitrospinota bacterium]